MGSLSHEFDGMFQHSLTYYTNGSLGMVYSTSLLGFGSFGQKNKYNHAELGRPFGRAELCHKGYVVGSSTACICSKGYVGSCTWYVVWDYIVPAQPPASFVSSWLVGEWMSPNRLYRVIQPVMQFVKSHHRDSITKQLVEYKCSYLFRRPNRTSC